MEQLRFGKANGACGVLMRGEGGVDGKGVVDPYFYPLYAEAGALDLPICFHTGSAVPQRHLVERFSAVSPALTFPNGLLRTTFPILQAFHSLANQQVPDKFPETRWGFIEANSSWIPYLMYDLKRRQKKQAGRAAFTQFEVANDLLAHNRFWVTCQMDEDLDTIIEHAGEDHLVIGTDYSHPDPAFDLQLVSVLRERGEMGEVRPAVVEKILDDNPRGLYAL
jgi:predicted TIM-barrel fold metal-dependent hydrolase